MTDTIHDRIGQLVSTTPVVLFMKGTPMFPQCGFSSTAVSILERLGVEFEGVDVLADPAIRAGIKEYSEWPTVPQLYIGGEFVGGSDIMMEMFQAGELTMLLDEAGVPRTSK
ncbi:MAG: Grx4 family monothiol glutaredoxin [Sandarakinorhabdus sp.]|nr:Grx4 family monothiol glutaredoxin [Sandarakinorhabdus sp.]